MLAFRKKTRSDEVVDPSQFEPGLTVWVGGERAREMRICTGLNGELLTLAEHRLRKAEQAERNRKNCYFGPCRPSSARFEWRHTW